MSRRTIREWREDVIAVAQHVYDLRATVTEGFQLLPGDPEQHLTAALDALDEFDRAMAKLDGDRTAAGGRVELVPLPIKNHVYAERARRALAAWDSEQPKEDTDAA